MNSFKELLAKNKKISEIVIEKQMEETGQSWEEIFSKMTENLAVMKESAKAGMKDDGSFLVSGIAKQFGLCYNKTKLLSEVSRNAMAIAMSVSGHNACMGRIVAAPTAGSCGILPGVLIASQMEYGFSDEELVYALFNSGGVCSVIAENASVSGAEGGCQAECGTASAISASALVELMGGTPKMCGHAAAFALKFVMGLVCDPVGGLVEVPCVKRNASGAINAFAAAEMSLSGIESVIPVDEVIKAMGRVGKMIHYSLRETALGGIAATKTGIEISEKLKAGREKA